MPYLLKTYSSPSYFFIPASSPPTSSPSLALLPYIYTTYSSPPYLFTPTSSPPTFEPLSSLPYFLTPTLATQLFTPQLLTAPSLPPSLPNLHIYLFKHPIRYPNFSLPSHRHPTPPNLPTFPWLALVRLATRLVVRNP